MNRKRKLEITISRLEQLLHYGFLADVYLEAIRWAKEELERVLREEESWEELEQVLKEEEL